MYAANQTPDRDIARHLDIIEVASVSARLPSHVGRDDLASVGKVALIATLQTSTAVGNELRSHLYVRVRGAILDELRGADHRSRGQRAKLNLVSSAQRRLRAELNRDPDLTEITEDTGLASRDVARTLVMIRAEEASKEPIAWDSLADDNAVNPKISAEAGELHALLMIALERLPKVQARVLRSYYIEDQTLEGIACDLKVSIERVRQIRVAGVTRLRLDFAALGVWQTLLGSDH
jgi:RNA polymerase sigma factor for flagellar operon FliA